MAYPRFQRARQFKKVVYTGGNITLNATALTELAALDMVLTAQVGDQIKYGISGRLDSAAVATGFDVYTIVSSARVNPFGPGLSASLGSTQGVPGWYGPTGVPSLLTGEILGPPLAVGDLASGEVRMRLVVAQTAATARNLHATANVPLIVWAQNLGPADPN